MKTPSRFCIVIGVWKNKVKKWEWNLVTYVYKFLIKIALSSRDTTENERFNEFQCKCHEATTVEGVCRIRKFCYGSNC